MNILCRLGIHDWRWKPRAISGFFASCFYYRWCVRCNKKQEIYEGLAGSLEKDIEKIPEEAEG